MHWGEHFNGLRFWSGRGGITGRSLNSWDRDTRRWHQHWVDSQGGLLRLEGAAAEADAEAELASDVPGEDPAADSASPTSTARVTDAPTMPSSSSPSASGGIK